jgi:hypothetical protein
MDWIKENKFLSGYIAALVIGVAVLTFLLLSARSGFRKAQAEYEDTRQAVQRLRAKDLYPSEPTLGFVNEKAAEYREVVDGLHQELLVFQRPLPAAVTGGSFQKDLTDRVVELKKRSVLEKIALPENFNHGFDRYTAEQPSDKALGDLQFHLEAIDFLANALFDAGITQVDSLARPPLAVEADEQAPAPAPDNRNPRGQNRDRAPPRAEEKPVFTTRYAVTVCFTGTSESLEQFLNRIANTSKEAFVYNVRYLTVKNQSEEGPPKGIPFDQSIRENATGGEPADAGAEPGGVGESTVSNDSRIVLGSEEIKVCVVIDAVRFADLPADQDGDAGA